MTPSSQHNDFALASVGIDIGKDVFHIVGFNSDGKIALRRKIRRSVLVKEFEKLPPCIVGMEACPTTTQVIVASLVKVNSVPGGTSTILKLNALRMVLALFRAAWSSASSTTSSRGVTSSGLANMRAERKRSGSTARLHRRVGTPSLAPRGTPRSLRVAHFSPLTFHV